MEGFDSYRAWVTQHHEEVYREFKLDGLKKGEKGEGMKKEEFCKISLVIPTHNEQKLIEQKLNNTFALNYPKDQLSIVVVDSGSTDRTREIVSQFPGVKLIREKVRKGKAHALITAFNDLEPATEIVIISDVDSRLEKDILTKALKYFKNEKVLSSFEK